MRKRKSKAIMSGRRISLSAAMSFWATIALCCVVLAVIISSKAHLDRLLMEQLIMEKSAKLTEIISKLLYKTEALSALVIQSDGKVNNFERVAATLLDDPAISNVLIAPAGVVTHVYPIRGNEGVLGFDFFKKGAGNKEAAIAKETGQLVFGGPFFLVQGGQALVGRLPVYMTNPKGEKVFWGLVSVTLKYPQALDGAGLALLEKQGYAYEIWRINPDSGERQIIASSDYEYNKSALFIEKRMEILNATWFFRISPVKIWYQYPETWVMLFVGFFISCLVAFVMQNNHELKLLQGQLERIAQSDPLTGIANRRHFMDTAPVYMQQAARNKQRCFIIMFDVDHFKQVNDTYGHAAGDEILKVIAARVKRTIRPYDLFARYGGEEFIIFVTDVDKKAAENLTERIRMSICESPFICNGTAMQMSASFGLAQASPTASLDEIIRQADNALYEAKKGGRNKSVCYATEGVEAGFAQGADQSCEK